MPYTLKIFLPIAFIFITGISSFAQNKDAIQTAKTIKAKELKEKLTIIAGAEMEGRETATAGQRKAAAYIESYFKSLGLQPANGNSFQMYFPVYQDSIKSSQLIINNSIFNLNDDYSFNSTTISSGNYNANEIVFAGYGSIEEDYQNVDIKNKWVLVLQGSVANPADNSSYSLRQKTILAKAHNAAGLLIVRKDFPLASFSKIGSMTNKPDTSSNTYLPVVYISQNVFSAIINKDNDSITNIAELSKDNYAANLFFSLEKITNQLQSSNVIAMLPGTDKKDEYIFITAHYDHLGKRGDKIFFGADDDGSGTTSVLQLAEAFAKARDKGILPQRNIIFMTVSGEEKGLWGSEYYTSHPIFPLAKLSVDLNIDMVGRKDPKRNYGHANNYIYTIGDDKLSSELAPITDSINGLYTHLELDRKFNDPADPNRFYYRSDHYNFAKNGVPVIFYFNGTHADYHQPTDTVDKINFDLMKKRVKLIFFTAWEMANRPAQIKRDIPLK